MIYYSGEIIQNLSQICLDLSQSNLSDTVKKSIPPFFDASDADKVLEACIEITYELTALMQQPKFFEQNAKALSNALEMIEILENAALSDELSESVSVSAIPR